MKGSTAMPAKKRPVKKQQIIVLEDGAGNYYELPRSTLEKSRVSDRRKEKIVARIEDVPSQFAYIAVPTIAGSIASAPFVGGRQLHYAGFYLETIKSKSRVASKGRTAE
jgi:hypothetical protein